MILSLAASENIPIIEAKRKILQNSITPKDTIFDFNNFPLLNPSKSVHNSNNNYNSHTYDSNTSQHNRFSVLNALNQSEATTEGSLDTNLSLNGSYKKNRQTF